PRGGLVRLDRALVGAVRDPLQRASTMAQPHALVVHVVDLLVAHLPLAGEEGAAFAGERLLTDLEHLPQPVAVRSEHGHPDADPLLQLLVTCLVTHACLRGPFGPSRGRSAASPDRPARRAGLHRPPVPALPPRLLHRPAWGRCLRPPSEW